MQQDRIKPFLFYTGFFLCLLIWGFVLLHWLIPATLPFWLGLLIAFLLRPLTLKISGKLHLTPKSCRIRHHLILFCPWRSTLAFTKPCLGTALCFDGKYSRTLQDLVSSDTGTLFRVAFRSSIPICAGPRRNRSAVDAKLCSNRRKTFLQPFFLAAGDLYSDGGKAPHVVFERHCHHLLFCLHFA